jgi:hypothetical protein
MGGASPVKTPSESRGLRPYTIDSESIWQCMRPTHYKAYALQEWTQLQLKPLQNSLTFGFWLNLYESLQNAPGAEPGPRCKGNPV